MVAVFNLLMNLLLQVSLQGLDMPFIEFKYQIPKLALTSQILQNVIIRGIEAQSNLMIKDLQATTATWQEHKPSFYKTVRRSGSASVKVSIGTQDEIWNYLEHGTSERWAVMSRNFQPKTVKGQFSSRAGSGYARLRGKGIMTKLGMSARKGIEGRNWFAGLQKKYKPTLTGILKSVISNAIRSSIKVIKGP